MQTLLYTWNGTTHYPGTRHNYEIKDTKIAEIHKPEGPASLTPHPPLQRHIPLRHFTFPVTLLVLSSNSLSHVRSFYAVFSPICCMRWSASPSRGSRLQGLDYGQSHQRIYLGRLTHSKVPTTALSSFSPFNLKSEEYPLSEALWVFWSETMDHVQNVSYGLWSDLQSGEYNISHSKTSCGSAASVPCEK